MLWAKMSQASSILVGYFQTWKKKQKNKILMTIWQIKQLKLNVTTTKLTQTMWNDIVMCWISLWYNCRFFESCVNFWHKFFEFWWIVDEKKFDELLESTWKQLKLKQFGWLSKLKWNEKHKYGNVHQYNIHVEIQK